MLNDIEKYPIEKQHTISVPLSTYCERGLFAIQNITNGERESRQEARIKLLAGMVGAAYQLGRKDGINNCVKRIQQLFIGGE